MPDGPALIVDRWIKDKLPFVWKFAPILTPRIVLPGTAHPIASLADLTCEEGVLWSAAAIITSPVCSIRFESPDFDTQNNLRIDNILALGETMPNTLAWARGPPDIAFYQITLAIPYLWKEWGRVSLVNLDTVSISVLQTVYLVALQRGEYKPL